MSSPNNELAQANLRKRRRGATDEAMMMRQGRTPEGRKGRRGKGPGTSVVGYIVFPEALVHKT